MSVIQRDEIPLCEVSTGDRMAVCDKQEEVTGVALVSVHLQFNLNNRTRYCQEMKIRLIVGCHANAHNL